MERPIFIFGSGWRSGSTLLQRLLCSHPEIHIWGENRGICSDLERMYNEIVRLQPLSMRAARQFRITHANAWIAMLNPPTDCFLTGIRALFCQYFGEPARRFGKSRWGFKEVRHGVETATFLRQIFPESKFLLLVRNPQDCLASARATTVPGQTAGLLPEIGEAAMFLKHWARIAASFLLPVDAHVALTLRYEDLIANPERSMKTIGEFLDVRASGFRRHVFKVRRRGWLEEEPRLTEQDLACLADAAIWDVARKYGYSPLRQ